MCWDIHLTRHSKRDLLNRNINYASIKHAREGKHLRKATSRGITCSAEKKFSTKTRHCSGYDHLWQADVVDMRSYSRLNKGHKYIQLSMCWASMRGPYHSRVRAETKCPKQSQRSLGTIKGVWKIFKQTEEKNFTTGVCRNSWRNTTLIITRCIPLWKPRSWNDSTVF